MPKQGLRQAILARRRALSAQEATASSRLIQQAFLATVEFIEARVVAIYAPIHNEVDTAEVMHVVLNSAKVLLFPAVRADGLELRRISEAGELQRGAFGIPEPGADSPLHSPGETDLFVIPGIAFDICGRRIGYGKGYYDRTLHHLEGKGKLVGFCYDFQLLERIAGEPHDVRMDIIITERRVIRLRY
jgi:5-formyltetrahydrofolate cyclo-ligase